MKGLESIFSLAHLHLNTLKKFIDAHSVHRSVLLDKISEVGKPFKDGLGSADTSVQSALENFHKAERERTINLLRSMEMPQYDFVQASKYLAYPTKGRSSSRIFTVHIAT